MPAVPPSRQAPEEYEGKQVAPSGGAGCARRVRPAKFGKGVVLHCEGGGSRAKVQVNFADIGEKWLMLGYANLQTLD